MVKDKELETKIKISIGIYHTGQREHKGKDG
jgi:hypothetical protein